MPNRFGRSVPVADYAPKALLPEGLLPVSRPDGSEDLQLANAANRVSDAFGTIADQAAKAEGTAAGAVAGNDPDFRPTGSMTIRGQAFDASAVKSYKDNLDASLRTDIQKVYQANKDDPVALKNGFDTLGDEYRAQHVFPEIMGEFNKQFATLRMPYENRALSAVEDLQKDQGKASLLNSLTASQTYARQASMASPNDPATAAIVTGETRKMDMLIDEAIENQTISAVQGQRLKETNRSTVTIGAAVAQAQSLATADAVAKYRDNVKKQFAAGKFANLTADGYDTLDSQLEQLQRAKNTEANAGVTLLKKSVDDYVQRSADGFPLSDAEWTRYATSDAANTPQGQSILQAGQAKLSIANVLRNRSVEDGERMVSNMRADLSAKSDTTGQQADIVRYAETYVKNQRNGLNTDQLGMAQQKQLIPAVSPLDFQGFAASNDPAAATALADQFRSRTAQARAVGNELQRAPQFLRPEEKERLKEIVDQGGPKALALAGAIVKGADTDTPNVLREISSDAPLLAQAGNILSSGGSISAARDAFQAAQAKAATGKELPSVAPATAQRVQRDDLGTAFSYQGEDGGRVRATADAIAKTRLDRAGVDPKSSDAEKIYRQALQEAAGATFVGGVQFGGVAGYKPSFWSSSAKVPVPANVRADSFRDVVRSITDADLKALPVPPQPADGGSYRARDIAGATPVWVRGGYRFARGDPMSNDPKFIRGADGNPFVLPFDRIDQFAGRVPGALRGGQ